MVVVRVVVSVTEVLRRRCLCWCSAVSAGSVSVWAGSDAVWDSRSCWGGELSFWWCGTAALNRLRKKILRNRIKNRRKGFIYFYLFRTDKILDNRSSPISLTSSGFSMLLWGLIEKIGIALLSKHHSCTMSWLSISCNPCLNRIVLLVRGRHALDSLTQLPTSSRTWKIRCPDLRSRNVNFEFSSGSESFQ